VFRFGEGADRFRGRGGGGDRRPGWHARGGLKGLDGSEVVVVAGAFNLKAELLKSTLAGRVARPGERHCTCLNG